ncbi:MAG: hypothetical protein HYU73_10585 [Betaproteobacteria bacterium]|nr:hypothetical protein [Betaproteobacteria bacterium]
MAKRPHTRLCAARPEASFMTQQARQLLVWVLLGVVLAYLSYISFRAYLGPDFLLGFANIFSC